MIFFHTSSTRKCTKESTGALIQLGGVAKEPGYSAVDNLLLLLQFFQHICLVYPAHIIREAS